MRLFCLGLQLAVLSLAGLAVAALSVPFTSYGLVNVPVRVQAGIYIFSKMPVEGLEFLKMLRILVWVPLITATVAFLPGHGPLQRLLRRAGAVVNVAALGYLLWIFPKLASPDRIPALLFGTGLLFLVSAVLLLASGRSGAGEDLCTRFFLLVIGGGGLAIFLYAALRQNAAPLAWAGIAGCAFALAVSFYGFFTALRGTKKGGNLFLLPPLVVLALFALVSPPLALPVGAGFLLLVAARLPG